MKPRVLHVIPNLVIGGAQRTIATLRKAESLDSRVSLAGEPLESSISWSDVVVIHAWRLLPDGPELNVPLHLRELAHRPTIIFNHDWEGTYHGSADLILVYSKFAAQHWRGPQPVEILPGGITLDRFSSVASSRNWPAVEVVGRLSTLHPGKISPQTLAHWPQIRARLFMVGGEGSQRALLEGSCRDERFRFVGEVHPRRTHEFLRQIDIFLYETEWHVESFCYVILEALAAGCVVISSNRGAITELVTTGKNGFLVDGPEDTVSLCNALLRNPSRCSKISESARISAQSLPSELMRRKFATYVLDLLG